MSSSHLYWIVLGLSCLVTLTSSADLEVRIGLLLTSGRCCTYQSYEDKAGAISIAIDNLHNDGILDKNKVHFK